jgi:glycosyltransferase involved in cell wall biosynthesis
MKRELLQLVPSLSSKIEVVSNPLLLPSPLPAPHPFPSNLFNLLYVGKLRPEKGVDLLLKALSLLPSRYHLWIVGDGPELPSLQNLTARLSLRERVHFLGPTSNPYPYYRGADLLVLPSRYEGLPNVVLEANGSGLPVVAFNCPGGTGEVVVEGVNGLLVECENWERLAERIEEGANRPWDREKIAEFTRNRFSPEVTTYRYQQLFLRVLKKN